MSAVYEGLDDEHFLGRLRGLYGHMFSAFQRSEMSIEARTDLVLDSTWGQRIESFGARIRAEVGRLRESEALTKYALMKGQACMISWLLNKRDIEAPFSAEKADYLRALGLELDQGEAAGSSDPVTEPLVMFGEMFVGSLSVKAQSFRTAYASVADSKAA